MSYLDLVTHLQDDIIFSTKIHYFRMRHERMEVNLSNAERIHEEKLLR